MTLEELESELQKIELSQKKIKSTLEYCEKGLEHVEIEQNKILREFLPKFTLLMVVLVFIEQLLLKLYL